MSYTRYANRAYSGWREFLTPDEVEKIAAIDKETAEIDTRRRYLTFERRTIQNRATQRALHDRRTKASA